MCDRDHMTITPKPHERKGHYLPFVNKPPVSGQFLSCQLQQSMTNLSCFESRLWSVSSFNAPCHPYSLWRFSSGSLKHDISPAESRKSSFSARSCAIGPGKHEWEPIHVTVGQTLTSYAKILTRFPAQPPQQSCPIIHLVGNLEGRWPLSSWLLEDVTSAQLLSIVWRHRCCVPTGLFQNCVHTGGFTVKSPGSMKKRPEWPKSTSYACASATSVFSCCPGFHSPFICCLPPVCRSLCWWAISSSN